MPRRPSRSVIAVVLIVLTVVVGTPTVATASTVDGVLDTSFGTAGRGSVAAGTIFSESQAVAVDAHGRVVLVGWADTADGNAMAFGRLNADGSPDPTFGADGAVVLGHLGNDSFLEDVLVDGSGRIVGAGFGNPSGVTVPMVVRLLEDGSLDTSFDGDGVWGETWHENEGAHVPASTFPHFMQVALDANGRIVASGQAGHSMIVARIDDTGSADPSFGINGVTNTMFGSLRNVAGLTILTDGSIVIGGSTDPDFTGLPVHDAFLAKLYPDGVWDGVWGAPTDPNGFVLLDRGGLEGWEGIAARSNGGFVAVGASHNKDPKEVLVAAYTAQGTLDTSFGAGGLVAFENSHSDTAYDVVVDASDRIIVTGRTSDGTWPSHAYVTRLLPDGTVDATFGSSGGRTILQFAGSSYGYGLALDGQGRIHLAGGLDTGVLSAARLTSTSSPSGTDVTAPTITVDSPLDGAVYGLDGSPTYEWSCQDEVGGSGLATCTAQREDGGFVSPGEGLDRSFDGPHTVTFTASDAAGNVTTLAVTYVVDGTPPWIDVTSPAENPTVSQDDALQAQFTCGDLHSSVVACSGQVVRDGLIVGTVQSGDLLPTDVAGSYYIWITAVDAVGNQWEAFPTYSVVAPPTAQLDTTPPAITVTSPVDGSVYGLDGSPTYEWSCQDEVGGSGVASCDAQRDDGWWLSPGEPLDRSYDGPHSVTFFATDVVGNPSSQTVTYIVDGAPPTITVTSPSGSPSVWQGELLVAGFACADDWSAVTTCEGEVVRDGLVVATVQPGDPLPTDVAGSYFVRFAAVDALGHQWDEFRSYTVLATTVTATFPEGGGTLDNGAEPTSSQPVVTSVTTTAEGPVEITSGPVTDTAPTNYSFLGTETSITAPPAVSDTQPIELRFRVLDEVLLASGITSPDQIVVFRDGVALETCTSAIGEPLAPQPACVREVIETIYGVEIVIHTLQASIWHLGHQIVACVGPAAPVALGGPVSATVTGLGGVTDLTVDWGDGSTPAGVVDGTTSHIYGQAGVYRLTCSGRLDGVTHQTVHEYVVIYDPEGGFVTGGGWITSPEGAFAADPTLTGKAVFGFVSRYKKGATVPSGDTEFQFHAAGMNFRSSSYAWLVVSGAKAQFKGVGTVNGGGDYGFLLTAVDSAINGGGTTDSFRIKIWDRGTGHTVYDNGLGSEESDTSATTALSGGSIVIHRAQ